MCQGALVHCKTFHIHKLGSDAQVDVVERIRIGALMLTGAIILARLYERLILSTPNRFELVQTLVLVVYIRSA